MNEEQRAALNKLVEHFHGESAARGWWAELDTVLKHVPPGRLANLVTSWFLATKIALIHSEVSEMMEGLRKGCVDDKLPDYLMEDAEAADIAIRLFDYCGYRKIKLGDVVEDKGEFNAQRADHDPKNRAKAGGKSF